MLPIAMIGGLISAIAGSIGTAVTTLGAIELAKWIATKVFWTSLVFVALPIILYNVIMEYHADILQWVISRVLELISTYDIQPVVIQLSSLGAWIGDCLRAPEQLAVVLTAVAVKYSMIVIYK